MYGRIEWGLLQQAHLFRADAIVFCTGAPEGAVNKRRFAQKLLRGKQEREVHSNKVFSNKLQILPEHNE